MVLVLEAFKPDTPVFLLLPGSVFGPFRSISSSQRRAFPLSFLLKEELADPFPRRVLCQRSSEALSLPKGDGPSSERACVCRCDNFPALSVRLSGPFLVLFLSRTDVGLQGHSLELLVTAGLKRLVKRRPEHGPGRGGLHPTGSDPGPWLNHLRFNSSINLVWVIQWLLDHLHFRLCTEF